jgi:hypothetical protein
MGIPEITDPKTLNAERKLYVVLKMTGRPKKGRPRVNCTAYSLSAASAAMQNEIEAKGYRIAECLGARVLDANNWPAQVACIHVNGRVYEDAPAEWGPWLP